MRYFNVYGPGEESKGHMSQLHIKHGKKRNKTFSK